jgi:hypothetical protein
MKHINRELLIRALSRLGELAQEQGAKLEVCLYGGAVMMLAYNGRAITKDVDAVIQPSDLGQKLARRVGEELDLPERWINDDVKAFLAPSGQTHVLPWDGPGIALTAPTAGYLLAMKALACRQALPGHQGDLDDLRFLIQKIDIRSVEEIQNTIDKYYPDDVIPPEHSALLETLIKERTA